jgi:RNA polymerase sigma factor (sigma-70 family)
MTFMAFDAPPSRPLEPSLAMMQVTEWQLARLKRMDAVTQSEVFRSFEKPLYTFCMRLMGQSADALDMLQESFIQAFTCVHQFRGECPFGAWLRAIALRLCVKRVKARDSWRDESFADETSTDAENNVSCANARMDLELALSQLSDQSRTVVWMYCVENYSHQEIADSFGLSVSFSKSCLARGLKSLREFLDSPEHTS